MLTETIDFGKENEEKKQGIGQDVFLAVVIILIGLLGFGLGRLSKIEENKVPVTLSGQGASLGTLNAQNEAPKGDNTQTTIKGQTGLPGVVLGSKNGSKYHYPWCPGAQQIKEANKVWFASIEDAKKAGYTPASNCEGL